MLIWRSGVELIPGIEPDLLVDRREVHTAIFSDLFRYPGGRRAWMGTGYDETRTTVPLLGTRYLRTANESTLMHVLFLSEEFSHSLGRLCLL